MGVWNDYFNITGFFNIFRLYYIRQFRLDMVQSIVIVIIFIGWMKFIKDYLIMRERLKKPQNLIIEEKTWSGRLDRNKNKKNE